MMMEITVNGTPAMAIAPTVQITPRHTTTRGITTPRRLRKLR